MKQSKEEERVQHNMDAIDLALEKFFNNVLNCIIIDENCFK